MKYLIAGLGNIGDEYTDTRHNIGFTIADALASALKTSFTPGRYAFVANASFKGHQATIIKPSTYMNLSGKALRYWLARGKTEPEHLLIVVDDLALPLGTLRLRKKGSDGGHNGLISIIETLQTTDFARLRVGIGNDFAKGSQVDYVLGRWNREEEVVLTSAITAAVEQIKCFILQGADRAMNLYNS